MRKKGVSKILSTVLALCMLISSFLPGFSQVARAQEGSLSMKLVDLNGDPIKEEVRLKFVDSWDPEDEDWHLYANSKDSKVVLSDLADEIDDQTFYEVSIESPKGYKITNLGDNKTYPNQVLIDVGSGNIYKFGADDKKVAVDTLVIDTGKVPEEPQNEPQKEENTTTEPENQEEETENTSDEEVVNPDDDTEKTDEEVANPDDDTEKPVEKTYEDGDIVTLSDIGVVYKDGTKVEDGVDFHTYNKNDYSMEDYFVRGGKLSGIKAPVGQRMKLGLNMSKADKTLVDTKKSEYFNYYWFVIDKNGRANIIDELSGESQGVLSKITVVKKADLLGEKPQSSEKVKVSVPVKDKGGNSIVKSDSLAFTLTGAGENKEVKSKDGILDLELNKGTNYTINLASSPSYSYKMNGFSFKVNNEGSLVKEDLSPMDSIYVYQGSYTIKVEILNGGSEVDKDLEFEIREKDTNKIQNKTSEESSLSFEAYMYKSYTIILKENDTYKMNPVNFTMKSSSDDGLFWPILEDIPEGDDGKLKALKLKRLDGKDVEEVKEENEGVCGPEGCTLIKEEVKTKEIPVVFSDGTKGENKSFVLFNSTEQKFEKKIEIVDGKIPSMTLNKGFRYFIQLVDRDYEMQNIYFEVMDNGLSKFKEEAPLTSISVSKKATPKEEDGKYDFNFRVRYGNKNAEDGIKIDFISEFDKVSGVVKDGNVKLRLFEDLTYTVVVGGDKYAAETVAVVVKDKSEWEEDKGKYTFDHRSCYSYDTIQLVDAADLEYLNKGRIVCTNGNTSIVGMDFKDYVLRVEQISKATYPSLISKDVSIYDIKLINPFRCEVSKILSGDFTITRNLSRDDKVSAVYELHENEKLVPVKFTQDGKKIRVKVDNLSVYPIVVEYEGDKKPSISTGGSGGYTSLPVETKNSVGYKVERTSGDDRYKTAIEISKKSFNKADTVIVTSGRSFPDSLSASPLAYSLNSPILLSSKNSLGLLENEIKRLGAKNIIIIGGENSVGIDEENYLRKLGNVSRISGADRYETSLNIAKELLKSSSTKSIVITDGKNYPDALAIGSYAGRNKTPIILAKKGSIDYAMDLLRSKEIENALIIGGKNSVDSSVEKNFNEYRRIAGNDRYETSRKIADELFKGSKIVNLVSGQNFPDALTLSPYASRENTPILLTEKNRLNSNVGKYIEDNKVEKIQVFGGENSVPQSILK